MVRGESFQLTGTNQFHGKGTDEKSKKRKKEAKKWEEMVTDSRAEAREEKDEK